MSAAIENTALPATALTVDEPIRPDADALCFHCGQACGASGFLAHSKPFCCTGCETVHDILAESGLERFYQLSPRSGVRLQEQHSSDRFRFLDDPAISSKLLDFTDGKLSRVTLQIPAIHCVACVWLLENLFRLNAGIGRSTVNFPRRELSVVFSPEQCSLGQLVGLLASIGYEPRLTLGGAEKTANPERTKGWLQIGIAGFAFGNVMLMSLPLYLGLDSSSGPFLRMLFGCVSLVLALPVVFYSAADYWRSAFASIRQRALSLDVPICLGLAALYIQSAVDVLGGRGPGYLDSLCGLVFFLLCGKLFQRKFHDRIAFDRDYKSFFPLSARRVRSGLEEVIALADIQVGDRLRLRHGELLPADGTLLSGEGLIDYSFVSGESEPVSRLPGDHLYAGGKQIGGGVEIETVKPVSQSYLVSLWNHEAFRKDTAGELNSMTNRLSRWFTVLVIGLAFGAMAAWTIAGQPGRGLKAFVSILIVACPCALALAAPFTLGTAQRYLGRIQMFLRNVLVLERMARVRTIVLDKTGTLTMANAGRTEFHPVAQETFSAEVKNCIRSLAAQSLHPNSMRIREALNGSEILPVTSFEERPGFGIAGIVQGRAARLGSAAWLQAAGIHVPAGCSESGTYVALDQRCLGVFSSSAPLRKDVEQALAELSRTHEVVLLSGDNDRERRRFEALLAPRSQMHFNQTPALKLAFVEQLQKAGPNPVMMVGDGLNDAGALKQSDVGVAVVDSVGAFSPASDVVLEASQVSRLPQILALARRSVQIVRLSFLVSFAYNVLGVAIASAGILSPVFCAVLMPLSSITVVLLACGLTARAARQLGIYPEA